MSLFISDKGLLRECMDIIGEMYKVKFHPNDYCKAPVDTYPAAPVKDTMGNLLSGPPELGPDVIGTATNPDISNVIPPVSEPDMYAAAPIKEIGNILKGPAALGPDVSGTAANQDIGNVISPLETYAPRPIQDMGNLITDQGPQGNLIINQGPPAPEPIAEPPTTYDQTMGSALLSSLTNNKNDRNTFGPNLELNLLNSGPLNMNNENMQVIPEAPVA